MQIDLYSFRIIITHMNEFPVPELDPEITSRSPVLRAFLDPTLKDNYQDWLFAFNDMYLQRFQKMANEVGEDRLNLELQKCQEETANDDIFNIDIKKDKQLYFISVILTIGYEVGDEGQAGGPVYGKASYQLINSGLIRDETPSFYFTRSTLLKRSADEKRN